MQLEGPTSAGLMYSDTGGDGPAVVLLHGVLMGGTLWDTVTEDLRDRYRCIVAELPFGAHTTPMPDDADLSLPALATLIAEFLTELDYITSHSSVATRAARYSSSAPAAPIVSPAWPWSPARPSTTTRPRCPAGCFASTQRRHGGTFLTAHLFRHPAAASDQSLCSLASCSLRSRPQQGHRPFRDPSRASH